MRIFLNLTILALSVLLIACEGIFQYNPNQVVLKESEKNLNSKNMERIAAISLQDTVKFIVMGDTQRWYDESDDFVKSANRQPDISFVLHAGDISDFGLTQEFKWVNEIMQKLNVPYLTVIGNHDIVANGNMAYRKMYGEMNYTFEYGNNKFVFINTNSREYAFSGNVPDLPWLSAQLTNNPDRKNVVVIAHVPPFDGDFDSKLEKEYAGILARDPNVKFTLYGHQHTFKDGVFYDDGVHYYLTTSMGARGYLVVSTWKGGYQVKQVAF